MTKKPRSAQVELTDSPPARERRTMNMFSFKATSVAATACLLAAAALFSPRTQAAQADISSTPLSAINAAQVKPNVMLLMDTSTSMGWTHMPDAVEDAGPTAIGYKSSQCNSLYYNPSTTYPLPRKPNKNDSFPVPAFTNAPYAGYASYYVPAPDATDLSMVNLATSFRAYDTPKTLRDGNLDSDPAQPAYYYVYTGSQTLMYASPACADRDDGVLGDHPATGGGTWTRTLVSTAQQANFAMWYSYYRTRMALVKSAASLAFTPLTDSFRVGFITVEPAPYGQQAINSDKYVEIHDFDSAQRGTWFTKLFSQVANGASPAREGLARVGRHYAGLHDGINTGMTGDPVQYYCQQNFTILTTDGYWNAQTETPRNLGGGPVDVNGNLVGEMDGTFTGPTGNTPFGVWDGSSDAIQRTEDNEVSYARAVCGSFAMMSTEQHVAKQVTNLQTTSWLVKTKEQLQQKTLQLQATTRQPLQTTSSLKMSTSQMLVSTTQRLKTTHQVVATTSQILQTVQTPWQKVTVDMQSTSQMKQESFQTLAATTQPRMSTSTYSQETEKPEKETVVISQKTPLMARKTWTTMTYVAVSKTTLQTLAVSKQTYRSTNQWIRHTESETPVAAPCTPVGTGYQQCSSNPTAPTLNYTGKCVPSDGQSGDNKYTIVTCTDTDPVTTPVQSCTSIYPTLQNGQTTVTCVPNNPPPVLDNTCKDSVATEANNWTTTKCEKGESLQQPVQSCTPDLYINCYNYDDGGKPVSSCDSPDPSASNNWTTTVCSGGVFVPVTSCTSADPAACSTADSGWYSSSVCIADPNPSQSNGFTATFCRTTIITSKHSVTSCNADWDGVNKTNCYEDTTPWTPVASCTQNLTRDASTNYTAVFCDPKVTPPTPVPLNSCTAGTDASFTTTTCSHNDHTPPEPVAGCVAGVSADYITTNCYPKDTPWVPVDKCDVVTATSGNGYTSTNCMTTTISNGPVASCTEGTDSSTHYRTTCTTVPSTKPVQFCTPSANVTCTPSVKTFGVKVCVASDPTEENGWTTTTCPPVRDIPDVPVQFCDGADGSDQNDWVTTTCRDQVSPETPVQSCDPVTASEANHWTATNCIDNSTKPVGVASCTPVIATGPSWKATNCTPVYVPNVPVQICNASGPTDGNDQTTTTCSFNDQQNKPVASCAVGPGTEENKWTTTSACTTQILSDWAGVASCAAVDPGVSPNFVVTQCQTAKEPPVNVAPGSCQDGTDDNYVTTHCETKTDTTRVKSCTASGPDANFVSTSCQNDVVVFDGAVQSCVDDSDPNAGNNFTTTACKFNQSTPQRVASCSPVDPILGNLWTRTVCTGVPAEKNIYRITQTVTNSQISGGNITRVISTSTNTTGPYDLSACDPDNPPPPLPANGPAGNGVGPDPTAPCTAWPCTTVTASAQGGSSNSLADVAQYYYVTDLRPGMKPGVPATGTGPEDDGAHIGGEQHMTTFTIGLGVSGTLNYRPDYKTALTGDFADIRRGTRSWPIWPSPSIVYDSIGKYSDPMSIDDFWHAAVNGRGQFFSANNPSSVVSGLAGALASVQTRLSAGAAVGASNLQPVVGDNFVYFGSYKTQEWSGDVTASTFNLSTGMVDSTSSWSASAQLGLITKDFCDTRQIFLMRGSSLTPFTWNTQQCDANGNPNGIVPDGLNATEMADFDASKIALLSQMPSMTDGSGGTVDQVGSAAGSNLVNFLRGQRGLEGFETNVVNKLYRSRASSLGDVVGGQPVYVSKPSGTYADSGYAAFAGTARTPMVYVAANDGMLHAFYAGATPTDPQGGKEAWAIVPSAMLPNMYKLADNNYKNNHQFFVDGTPTVADVKNGSSWRTMLIGGFNDGGQGYYALDISAADGKPTPMWEFKFDKSVCSGPGSWSDCNLGLSYGKPIVTKIKDGGYPEGRWVVLVSSGYNNVNGNANDGHGFLYVLDANNGVILNKIDTGAQFNSTKVDGNTPSNLGQLNAYVDDASINNLALRAYGTDMQGGIWNFDIANNKAILVGQAKDAGGTPQPITTRPELAELNGKPMVFVGTGRLLGTTDSTNLQRQSIYGIVDPLTGTSPEVDPLRDALKVMQMATNGNARTISCQLHCSSTKGWVVDLPDSGERVNIDMQLALSTLVVGSNVPTTDVCDSGGYSWLNYLDIASGEANGSFGDTPGPNSHVSERADNSLIVGLTVIRLPDRSFKTELSLSTPVGTSGGGLIDTKSGYFPTPKPSGKRISWRAVNQD